MITIFRLAFSTLLLALSLCPALLRAEVHDSVWWGYWNSSMPLQPTSSVAAGTTVCAIRLTTANAQFLDGDLHGVRFWLSDKSAVRRAYVWVSFRQFSGEAPDMAMQEIALDSLKDLQHDGRPTVALFDRPVSILPSANRYASAYVGYTIETTSPCPLMAAGSDTRLGAASCLVGWENAESARGPLALQLLVAGPNIASQGVAVEPLSETVTMAGEELSLPFRLTTDGTAPVESIDCQVTFNGMALQEHHFDLDEPLAELGLTVERTLTLAVPAAARDYGCQVAVTKVNGQPNLSARAAQTAPLIALSRRPLKRTVMEELTGTWCPNCPRGIVGIELLEQLYGDRFVPIAIHGGASDEPMRVADYDGSNFVKSVNASMGGRPSCSFDRTANADPYWGVGNGPHFGADIIVDYQLNEPCVADIGVSAEWNAGNEERIDCHVATTFRYSSDDGARYALMLVLTADSLTGEGSEWLQVNKLAGQTGLDDDLARFTQGERYMSMAYNHVAIAVKGVETGIGGSIASPLADGVAQLYDDTFLTAGNALVQRRDCLHVVAMLIDTQTRQVVNVAKAKVQTAAQGINEPSLTRKENAARYDIGGRPVTHSRQNRGISIEKGSKTLRSNTHR